MPRIRNWSVVLVCAGSIGCSEPEPDLDTTEGAIIHETVAGFDFLPPIAPKVPFTGVFDPTLSPVVQIDRIDPATGSTIESIASLTRTHGRGSERVRVSRKKQLYVARWHTRRYELDPDATYRIRILLGGLELGYADVDVVTKKKDLNTVDTSRYVGVVNGRTLPIKFRIAGGVVPPPSDTDGDGILDGNDNCPAVANADQLDTDDSGIGDACECLDVVCGSIDSCHAAGVCEPATGECVDPPAMDNCPPGPAPCPGADALGPDLEALDLAFQDAHALGLVGEPGLQALLVRDAAIAADLDVLRATCAVDLQADLAGRLPVLTADVVSWIASGPLGLRSSPPSFVLAGEDVSYAPALSVAPAGFTFALTTAPGGAAIDPSSGLFTWHPGLAAKGAHAILIAASDGTRTALQSFTLTVAERQPLATIALTAAAATITVSGTSTPLDGAVVRIPAGLIATADIITLSMIDPAPPSGPELRLPGPALELSFASGLQRLDVPVTIELPAPALAAGEHARMFAWSPPGGPNRDTPNGAWGALAMNGAAAEMTSAGAAAAGATKGAPLEAQLGRYKIYAYPGTTDDEMEEALTALADARTYIFQFRTFRDPGADQDVLIDFGVTMEPVGRCSGKATGETRIHISRECHGVTLRTTVAHELFHLVQAYTVRTADNGTLADVGGAMWWNEATAELVGNQFTNGADTPRPSIGLPSTPNDLVENTLTTWIKDGDHQYDSFTFFDYLTKRYAFSMEGFWETVLAADLMAPDGAGKVLLAKAGQGADGVPYLPFVHAYASDRTAANFNLLSATKGAPSYDTVPIPECGWESITEGNQLHHLSSRTYKISIPHQPATGFEHTQRLMVRLSGTNAEAWIYRDGEAAPFAKLQVSADAQDIGGPYPGETLWVHVGNNSVEAAGDGTFDLAFVIDSTPPLPPPTPCWGIGPPPGSGM